MNFKLLSIISLMFFAVSFSSCSKDEVDKELEDVIDDQDDKTDEPRIYFVVKADKKIILSDGVEEITFSAIFDTLDVTDSVQYFINEVEFDGNIFTTKQQNTYLVTAKYKDYVTDPVKFFAVREKVPESYTKKILVEQYTASWCGYCPRLSYKLNDAKSQNSNIISVAIHGSDEMTYKYISSMAERYNVSGYPTAILNRSLAWTENASQFDDLLAATPNLGLKISSSESSNNVSVDVSVGFAADLGSNMKLVVFVAQDGLVYDQTNYYNEDTSSPLYGLGNPIVGYVHNKVLEKSLTDVFGDPIPKYMDIFAGLYEWNGEFDVSGIDIANSHIVAFVMNGSFVQNVQIAKIGQTVDFD